MQLEYQIDAFDGQPDPALADYQSGNLSRVTARIGGAIIEFFAKNAGQFFRADDVRRYVLRVVGETAPGSADRVMRSLRQKHVLNYDVVNRSRSLYLASRVPPKVVA